MEDKKILEKLQGIFQDIFADDTIQLTYKTSAADIEAWDSLMHITMLEVVQEEFSVKFSFDEIVELENVGDMVAHIQKKLDK